MFDCKSEAIEDADKLLHNANHYAMANNKIPLYEYSHTEITWLHPLGIQYFTVVKTLSRKSK